MGTAISVALLMDSDYEETDADDTDADDTDADDTDADDTDAYNTDTKHTDEDMTDAEQTDAEQTGIEHSDTEHSDEEQTDTVLTDSEQTDAEQIDAEQTDVQHTDVQQTDAGQTHAQHEEARQTKAQKTEAQQRDTPQTDGEQTVAEYTETICSRTIKDASNPLKIEAKKFQADFHLTHEAFLYVFGEVKGRMCKTERETASMPEILKLCATLKFLAQGSYSPFLDNRSMLSAVLQDTLATLQDSICAKWIKFENNDQYKHRAKLNFYKRSGIPSVIGCIDGTHIKIMAPDRNVQYLYYCKKGYFSLNVMILCDDQMNIKCINARYPGSSHDNDIFIMSKLRAVLDARYKRGDRHEWILGDSEYSLRPYLITPFPDAPEDSREALYNERHSKAREVMAKTIKIWKSRFRCLLTDRPLRFTPEKAAVIINVCAALHNICNVYNVPFNEVEDVDDDSRDRDYEPPFERLEDSDSEEAVRMRRVARKSRREIIGCMDVIVY